MTDSLIEKLEAIKGTRQGNSLTNTFDAGINESIAIIRQHNAAPDENEVVRRYLNLNGFTIPKDAIINSVSWTSMPEMVERVKKALNDDLMQNPQVWNLDNAAKAAIAAMGDASARKDEGLTGTTSRVSSQQVNASPANYAGGQPERLVSAPSDAGIATPDRQGEALIAEPPAPKYEPGIIGIGNERLRQDQQHEISDDADWEIAWVAIEKEYPGHVSPQMCRIMCNALRESKPVSVKGIRLAIITAALEGKDTVIAVLDAAGVKYAD